MWFDFVFAGTGAECQVLYIVWLEIVINSKSVWQGPLDLLLMSNIRHYTYPDP
jgi:hypothetical protein